MAKVVLIGCTKRKKPYGNKYIARELYDAPRSSFPLKYMYAKLQQHDKIFILSAKYHLMDTDDEETKYEPYNTTLCDVPLKKRTPDLILLNRQERIEWAKTVLKQLNTWCDLLNDEFLLVLGRRYYENLIPEKQCDELKTTGLSIRKYTFPSEDWTNLSDRKQKKSLRKKIEESNNE